MTNADYVSLIRRGGARGAESQLSYSEAHALYQLVLGASKLFACWLVRASALRARHSSGSKRPSLSAYSVHGLGG